MLKALELAGFKSFADRTRFDFPDGITVVVGPNGSGKSNVVDAMKWVLGSQSAKALRGKDMSDVIFKGSQTRGPAGAAEATIIFDNTGGQLPVDTPEVSVTRRVYRSGEGEYLINGQSCRLKDIRQLIRGTGIGIDAYSLIEQGKVDRMLNASAKDRRVIFEEAAGISRFKAKKDEAERRLTRVQVNLDRLRDIVDEVGNRLKTLQSQAGKAQKHHEATLRMRALRTSLAWSDWSDLQTAAASAQADRTAASQSLAEAETAAEAAGAASQAAELRMQSIAAEAQELQSAAAEFQKRIAHAEGTAASQRTARIERRSAVAASLWRLRALAADLADARAEVASATAATATLTRQAQTAADDARQSDRAVAELTDRIEQAGQQNSDLQLRSLKIVRQIAAQEAATQKVAGRAESATAVIAECEAALVPAIEDQTAARAQADAVAGEVAAAESAIAAAKRVVELADAKLAQSRRIADRRSEEVAALRIRRGEIAERVRLLTRLQASREGVDTGVRDLLTAATDQKLHGLVGLVADLVDVRPDVAPLVDVSLGKHAQTVVVTGPQISDAIAAGRVKLGGRVTLIRLDELPPRRPGDRIRLDGLAGVSGRADRLIDCDDSVRPLITHLLGHTWLVDSLASALGMRKLSGAGLRFVTADGQLLDNDGSTVVGPPSPAGELVTRRAELSAAESELKLYEFQIDEAERELPRLRQQLDEHQATCGRGENSLRDAITTHAAVTAKAHHVGARAATADASVQQWQSRRTAAAATLAAAAAEAQSLRGRIAQLRDDGQRTDAQRQKLEASIAATNEQLAAARATASQASVAAAEARQRVESESARGRSLQAARDRIEQQRLSLAGDIDTDRLRLAEAVAAIQSADTLAEQLRIDSHSSDEALAKLAAATGEVRVAATTARRTRDESLAAASAAREQLLTATAAAESSAQSAQSLARRMAEDYQIDLHGDPPPAEDRLPIDDRDAAESEIQRLRQTIQSVGSVNMEAVEELQSLQSRYDQLHGQYQDLTAAKDSLHRMIVKINADSRRLFDETLAAIRTNFQKLYRKSFGGGHADLVLEDSADPMEAGVEIVATPPGKPSFSNSLLSGGEKALTAVALLMSIFQYRPSPFCVLDEVDAPFDEANIGRFVAVLQEFLDHSKFVVVTHSKKTMTAADTLYGVTMQESGVSKQVSIAFEDVTDDGQIKAAA